MRLATTSHALFALLLFAPLASPCADVVLQKAPPLTVREAPNYPENLARFHFGADLRTAPQGAALAKLRLSSNGTDENMSAGALLCDDPTIGYELPAGKSAIFVSLPNIENIQSISFLNHGAQGEFAIALSNADVSANSPEWHHVERCAMTPGAMVTKVGPGEAKYVRFDFNLTQPGRIAAFGVYATPALSDFIVPRPRKFSFEENLASVALVNFNFSDVHAKARGLYVSSGDVSRLNDIIDDQPATAYQFAKDDAAPTAVIDLGRERNLSRISAVYASQPGTVLFYVLDALPGEALADDSGTRSHVQQVANLVQAAELPSSLRISSEVFAKLKPIGSVVSTGEGRASVDFPPVAGRYIMLKWNPASVDGNSFSVAQVAAFGPAKVRSTTELAGPARRLDGKEVLDGKAMLDGKTILDNKNIPAEGPEVEAPGEGPAPPLPPVPPFTFIPQVPPFIPNIIPVSP